MAIGKYAKEAVEKVQIVLDEIRQRLKTEVEGKMEAVPKNSLEAMALYAQYVEDNREISTSVYNLFVGAEKRVSTPLFNFKSNCPPFMGLEFRRKYAHDCQDGVSVLSGREGEVSFPRSMSQAGLESQTPDRCGEAQYSGGGCPHPGLHLVAEEPEEGSLSGGDGGSARRQLALHGVGLAGY
jgi:hypothetical protein